MGGIFKNINDRVFREVTLRPATAANRDTWLMIGNAKSAVRMPAPFPIAPCTTDPVDTVYEKRLAGAGATLPVRDAVDVRVAQQIRTGTGRIVNSQKEVGGWPVLAPGTPPADTDGDGMPDARERSHRLNPADPADGAADRDGYTKAEEFLNGTNPRG